MCLSTQGQRLEKVLQSGKVYAEFEEIPKVSLVSIKILAEYDFNNWIQDLETSVGSNPENRMKNRYKDILPYDVIKDYLFKQNLH